MSYPVWFALNGAPCAECSAPARYIDVRRQVHHVAPKPPCRLPEPLTVLRRLR